MSNSSVADLIKSSYFGNSTFKESYYNVPDNYKEIKTLKDLLEIKYKYKSTKNQLRENLINKIRNYENPFPGIIGFNDTVIPAIKRALLSGHDILFIGHIGQGKTKLAELISENLLSPIPTVEGTVTNDIPTEIPYNQLLNLLQGKEPTKLTPEFYVSKDCEEIIKNNGLDTKIKWTQGKERYRYILATPDISVKDLVGQIDVVKAIKKGIEVFDIDSYSPGYLLQARYGILCLDELPVLDPRKQVTLLSILQEGRFTTGSYPVFFKPDVKVIATANPIDYTHSGKIIEPLEDRLKSHIETHYPLTLIDEILILMQETDLLERTNTFIPSYILTLVANIFQSLRNDPEINADRGVSVRSTIHSLELIIGEVENARSIFNKTITIPRLSDVFCIFQSSKFELDEMEDDSESRSAFLTNIINKSIRNMTTDYLKEIIKSDEINSIKNEFKAKTFVVTQNQYQAVDLNKKKIKENYTEFKSKSNEKSVESSQKTILYSHQLNQFPTLKKIINRFMETLDHEHMSLIEKAKEYNIIKNLEYFDFNLNFKERKIGAEKERNEKVKELDKEKLDKREEELVASITEIILEYLRFSNPSILDRKENKFYYKE